jgi:glycosyltransferase involved in cell wall biosynthesis
MARRRSAQTPLRITYWCQFFWPEPSAPSRRLLDFGRAWQRLGHRVTVVTAMPSHPLGVVPPAYRGRLLSREVKDGLRVLRSWAHASPNQAGLSKLWGHISFAMTSLLLSGPRLGRTDVIIASSPTFFSVFSAWATARLLGARFVFEVRDLWPEAFVELGILRRGAALRALSALSRFLYARADSIVVVTESFAERIADLGIPRSKITIITNGADLDWLSADVSAAAHRRRQELGLEGRFVVAYIGAHGVSHALRTVLQAAECAVNPAITFLFVGDGGEKPTLEAYRHAKQLHNVVMIPAQPPEVVRDFYALADVCLVPLRDIPLFEAFIPSKMFEIMAAGRPIIGSVRGEARRILETSHAALLVQPENPAELLEAVMVLYDAPAQRSTLGQNGRRYVAEHYSREVLAARYIALLKSLVR